jgi:hypothetical protein
MRVRNILRNSLFAPSSVKLSKRPFTTPAAAERRVKNNAEIALVKKKTQKSHEILLQLTENKQISAGLHDRVKNLLSTHQAKSNEFQSLLDKESAVIKNIEELLDGLTKKRKRAQDKSVEIEKNIISLSAHLSVADSELKNLKRELKAKHDGSYIPFNDFYKDELLLKHTLSFNESCELIAAICAETNEQSYPFLAPEKEDTLKRYLHDHGNNNFENMSLKILDKEKFIKECTKDLELRTRERDLVTRKIHLVEDQISMLNSQLTKLNKHAGQLQELAAMNFDSVETESLVESRDPNVTKLSRL